MAKPKQNKYSRARVRANVRRTKRTSSSRGWVIASIAIVAVGALLVVLSYQDNQARLAVPPIANQDHWHAYLGVNICGTWEPPVPKFEGRDGSLNPTPQAGIHSHADYLIHDHPFASDEAGKNATLGRYLNYAQTTVTATSIKLWPQWVPGIDKSNGDKCPNSKKPGKLYWKKAKLGKPWPTTAESGNPSDWHIENGWIVALYFVPEGDALDKPPGADKALQAITDLNGQSAIPTSSTTAPAAGGSSSSSSTPPASNVTSSSSSTSQPSGSTSTTKP
jgi:hypothetical protein